MGASLLEELPHIQFAEMQTVLGATLNTVVTFSNPVVTTLIAWLKLFAHFKTIFDCGSFFVEFSCGDAIESHLLRLGLVVGEATFKR